MIPIKLKNISFISNAWLKLKLKNVNDVDSEKIIQYQQGYSYGFRKLYSGYNQDNYKCLCSWVEKEFNLNSWFLESLKIDVKTKQSQVHKQHGKQTFPRKTFVSSINQRNKLRVLQEFP